MHISGNPCAIPKDVNGFNAIPSFATSERAAIPTFDPYEVRTCCTRFVETTNLTVHELLCLTEGLKDLLPLTSLNSARE